MPRPRQPSHSDGTASRQRRDLLRAKGPLNWANAPAERGPKRLALKNRELDSAAVTVQAWYSGSLHLSATDVSDMIAMIGEYVGTVLFMIFALGGTNVALTPATTITGSTTTGQDDSAVSTVNTSNLLYIALSFGFSLAVNAWIFFRVSGGLFNPAVSLGMALVGALSPTRAVLLSFVQILGGITGAAIIDAITPGTL
jgi:aquaporin related protein